MSSTNGDAPTTPTGAEEKPGQPAAGPAPPSSPLVQEVDQGHPLREAMEAADAERQAGGLGKPGRPLNRRSPFLIGMKGAAGVAVTYGLVELFLRARSVLILIGLAFFIAAGLDPVVVWLARHGLRRWMGVTLVIFALFALILEEVAFRRLDNS